MRDTFLCFFLTPFSKSEVFFMLLHFGFLFSNFLVFYFTAEILPIHENDVLTILVWHSGKQGMFIFPEGIEAFTKCPTANCQVTYDR